jgi:23S rRNA pseudouridine955/2504/2580 synthase
VDNRKKNSVSFLIIDENHDSQRIDNYLLGKLKGLPKSRLYKALRKGEIRVNKKRISPDYKLQSGDSIRLPPLRLSVKPIKPVPGQRLCNLIKNKIIWEDGDFLILNKPSGIAVHGGSGIHFGVIEILRVIYPKNKFLELAHRLDKETSGCLVIAKKSSILKEIHALLKDRKVRKSYLLLVAGRCTFKHKMVDVPLKKNILKSGERVVKVNSEGKPAKTLFKCIKVMERFSLLEAKPITGRTHQIRVHAAWIGHPILGDEKYGTEETNKILKAHGINLLCLHSLSIQFYLASKEKQIGICALLDEPWRQMIYPK